MSGNDRRAEKRRNTLQAMATAFVMVPAQLLCEVAEGKITASAFALYCYLLFRQGKNDRYFGGIQDICWGTGFSEAQVSRLLKQLIQGGHIVRQKRVGITWNTYCLTRVDGRKTLFRGKFGFQDTAFDNGTKSRTSNDEVIEAVELFKERIVEDKDVRADETRLEREIDELFRERQPRHPAKSNYF